MDASYSVESLNDVPHVMRAAFLLDCCALMYVFGGAAPQHAADERIRLEELRAEVCPFYNLS